MTWPFTITVMRSATLNTASMSCSISRIAWSSFSATRRSSMRPVSSAPMPASGSSRRSARGAVEAGGGEHALRDLDAARVACCRLPDAPRVRRVRLRRETTVLEHAELAEDGRALVAAADAGARTPRLRPARDVVAGEAHAPCARRELAREHVDERRLAGAVGADDGVDLADADVERHAVDRGEAAKAPAEPDRFEQRSRRAVGARRRDFGED